MQNLNDAINHAAKGSSETDDDECAQEQHQLSLWLQELRQLRKVEANKNFDAFTGRLLQRGWRLSPDGLPQIIKGGHNPISIEVLRIISADFLTYSVYQLEQLAKMPTPTLVETPEATMQSNNESEVLQEPSTSTPAIESDAPAADAK